MTCQAYPNSQHKPLVVAKGESGSISNIMEHASKSSPAAPYPMMYLRIAMSDMSEMMTSGTRPTLKLQAGEGDAVPVDVGTADALIYNKPGKNFTDKVAGAHIHSKIEHDVYLMIVTVYKPGSTWGLHIVRDLKNDELNNDDKPRAFVCVVADNEGESRQPWIELPSELDFGIVGRVVPGQPVAKRFSITNRGTGPLTIDSKIDPIPDGDFAIINEPTVPIDPNSQGEMEVKFTPDNVFGILKHTLTVNAKSILLKAVVAGITEAAGLTPNVWQGDKNLMVTIKGYGLAGADAIAFKHPGVEDGAVTGIVESAEISAADELYTVPVKVSIKENAPADAQWTFALSGIDREGWTLNRDTSFAVEERSLSELAQKSGQQGATIDTIIRGKNLEGVTELKLLDQPENVVTDLTVAKNGNFANGQLPVRITINDLAAPVQRKLTLQVNGVLADRSWSITKQQAFDVTEKPTVVDSINPTAATRGNPVSLTINGQRLGQTQAVALTKMGTEEPTVSVLSSKLVNLQEDKVEVEFTIPDPVEAGDYALKLILNSGREVEASPKFTVKAGEPSIQSIVPNRGRQGRSIVGALISGKNLENTKKINTYNPRNLFVTEIVSTTPTTVEAMVNIPLRAAEGDYELYIQVDKKTYRSGAVKFQVLPKPVIDQISTSKPIRPGYTGILVEIAGQGLGDPIEKILFRYKRDNSYAKVSTKLLKQTEAKIEVAIAVAEEAAPGSYIVEIITNEGYSIENRNLALLIDEKPTIEQLLSAGKSLSAVRQRTKNRPITILGKGLSDFDTIEARLWRWRKIERDEKLPNGLGGIEHPPTFPMEWVSEPDPNISIENIEWGDREIKATLTVNGETTIDQPSTAAMALMNVEHTLRLASNKYNMTPAHEIPFQILKGASIAAVKPDKVEINVLVQYRQVVIGGTVISVPSFHIQSKELEFWIEGENLDKVTMITLSGFGDLQFTSSGPTQLHVLQPLAINHLPADGEHAFILTMSDYLEALSGKIVTMVKHST